LKTRVISAVISLVLLFLVVWANQIVLGAVVFIVALIGIHEYYNSISNAGYKPIRIIGYFSCIPLLFIGMNGIFKKIDGYVELYKSINFFSFFIFIILVLLFIAIIFLNEKFNINDIALTFFGIIYVVFLFSFIILTRNMDNGLLLIWLIFIGAWATDTFAYFCGRFFGKTKLLPAVSPKKTVEGSIGGIFGCVAITFIYGIYLNNYIFASPVPLFHFVFLGILNGVISQVGDWAASAIKRYVKIKDYGNIMPGHGGVLDRFDSILFTAPTVYFYLNFFILN